MIRDVAELVLATKVCARDAILVTPSVVLGVATIIGFFLFRRLWLVVMLGLGLERLGLGSDPGLPGRGLGRDIIVGHGARKLH